MRIVKGRFAGRDLVSPNDARVRPTAEHVRAAMLDELEPYLRGARVLDLFAGSGALGIEALSRGASSVIFVEGDRDSIQAIERNLAKTKLLGRVQRQDVFDFLRQQSNAEKFEIIFADPPYETADLEQSYTAKLLNDERLPQLLEPNGLFVLEKRPGETISDLKGWRVIRQKTYGATEVLFLSRSAIANHKSEIK